MPNPVTPTPLYDSPQFMEDMWGYMRDPGGTPPPDPSRVNRSKDDFMRMIMAMLGPEGWMSYSGAVDKLPGAQSPTQPMAPSPTPTPGLDRPISGDQIEDWYRKLVGG